MSTASKRPGPESFGFMQRHKKSLNTADKEAQNRAITDINFNVPNNRNNLTSNLELNSQQQ